MSKGKELLKAKSKIQTNHSAVGGAMADKITTPKSRYVPAFFNLGVEDVEFLDHMVGRVNKLTGRPTNKSELVRACVGLLRSYKPEEVLETLLKEL